MRKTTLATRRACRARLIAQYGDKLLRNKTTMNDERTARELRNMARVLREYAKSELEDNGRNGHDLASIASDLVALSYVYDDGRIMLPLGPRKGS